MLDDSWKDLNNLIEKAFVLQNREQNQVRYITEKTNFFYNLLMNGLQKKKIIDENTVLLEDMDSKEEYLSYYNTLTNIIRICKKNALIYNDSNIKEMVWEESKQYFITLKNELLRVDILNSYTNFDMITAFYDIDDLNDILINYKTLWELICSQEFQSYANMKYAVISEVRSNINMEPKAQVVYSLIDNEKRFVLSATANKRKNINLNPFENHEVVVNTLVKYQDVLQKKLSK